MSFYSLKLERNNIKIPNEFCYLTIRKYTEDNFKPQKGSKLSKQENKEKREAIHRQEETIKQLNSGYCNLYNNKISLSSIFDSFFTSSMDNNNEIIYRIIPIASNDIYQGYSKTRVFEVSEFNTIRLTTKEEVFNQIYKDNLLIEFSATIFDNYSYGNKGYDLKLYEYFKYIKEKYPNVEISLSDLMLTKDYYHTIRSRSKFSRNDTYELTRNNIRYLLDNNLIKYFKENDYYTDKLVIGLIECGLYDVALNCVKLFNDEYINYLIKNKDFDVVLRKWTTRDEVKEIIKILDFKPSGITLSIKDDYDNIVETKTFENIGEVKTYLIKKYDIPFDKIVNKDIEDISTDGYKFIIE